MKDKDKIIYRLKFYRIKLTKVKIFLKNNKYKTISTNEVLVHVGGWQNNLEQTCPCLYFLTPGRLYNSTPIA